MFNIAARARPYFGAVVLSTLGGVLGIGLGYAVTGLAALHPAMIDVVVPGWAVLLGVGFSVGVGVLLSGLSAAPALAVPRPRPGPSQAPAETQPAAPSEADEPTTMESTGLPPPVADTTQPTPPTLYPLTQPFRDQREQEERQLPPIGYGGASAVPGSPT